MEELNQGLQLSTCSHRTNRKKIVYLRRHLSLDEKLFQSRDHLILGVPSVASDTFVLHR